MRTHTCDRSTQHHCPQGLLGGILEVVLCRTRRRIEFDILVHGTVPGTSYVDYISRGLNTRYSSSSGTSPDGNIITV